MRIKIRYGFENTNKRIGIDIQDNYVSGSRTISGYAGTSLGIPGHEQEKTVVGTE